MSSLKALFRRLYTPKFYLSVCCIQKDENEYLPEWIDYHRKLGVAHFYIYNNDSKVSPKAALLELIAQNIVTLIEFPGPQRLMEAFQHCLDNYGKYSRWIAFIDPDEFLVPKAPYGNLPGLLKEYEAYGGLGVNWLLYGSSGHQQRNGRPQFERFLMRSEKNFSVNTHIKSIIQPRYTKRVGNPHFFIYVSGKYCVNEAFARVEGPHSPHHSDRIQLNHYYCRSAEEFLDKINRGRADIKDERHLSQFAAHDLDSNVVRDSSALDLYRSFSASDQPY